MNSVLQCLFNVPVFSKYFREFQHLYDLRKDHSGIAREFGSLLSKYHDGLSVNTFKFKKLIGRMKSKFKGYKQQDA